VQKTLDFSKFMVCPYGQGELSKYGQFLDKVKEESIFRDCLRTYFMDDP